MGILHFKKLSESFTSLSIYNSRTTILPVNNKRSVETQTDNSVANSNPAEIGNSEVDESHTKSTCKRNSKIRSTNLINKSNKTDLNLLPPVYNMLLLKLR